ncbi:unnamed protein product [Echinostoma caproni]|uniref:5'-AMP-activated protein kinase subunit gamma-1 n=1 Tax=Echinostoma caproni TaxID=27848 RepID=A0A183ASJ8_9TREM|nr:unnamed protein product [Echinostoma caproni]
MRKKLRDLNLGTVSGVITVSQDCPLHRALQFFIDHRVSALPVVDSDGRLVDIYAKFDVIPGEIRHAVGMRDDPVVRVM